MINNIFTQEIMETVSGIIHVGAHRGEEAATYTTMGIDKVVWIEPNPDIFKELLHYTTTNKFDFLSEYHMVACGAENNTNQDFHIVYGPDAGWMVGNKGCSSLLKPTSTRFKEWHEKTITVPVMKLDDIIKTPEEYQLLCIDTQGADLLVLEGATKVLKHLDYVLCEVTWSNFEYENNATFIQVVEKMKEQGFVLSQIFQATSDWGDALFTRSTL